MVQADPERERHLDAGSPAQSAFPQRGSVNRGWEPAVTCPRDSNGGREVASVQVLWSPSLSSPSPDRSPGKMNT